MNLLNHKAVKVTIKRTSDFKWRPLIEPTWESVAKLKWDSGEVYKAQNCLMATQLDIFFLGFVIRVFMNHQVLSEGKYVKYELTHFALLDEAKKAKS
jgi:hypothetical protein